MIKKEKISKNNVVKFPSKSTDIEKEIEAVIFAAAEPLDVDTIESKISKKSNVVKSLEKLQQEYSNRGINLFCISIYLGVEKPDAVADACKVTAVPDPPRVSVDPLSLSIALTSIVLIRSPKLIR